MKEKHVFSDGYNKKKNALLSALADEKIIMEKEHLPLSISKKAVCIAVAAVLLTVSVLAAAELIDFGVFNDGEDTRIHAGLLDAPNPDDPLRAWVSDYDETSIKLVFDSMPEDILPNETAAGKWEGKDNSRAITFSGYDLRRTDFDSIIETDSEIESFYAGENKAYLIKDPTEAVLYNKTLYVLFEKEQMLIKAKVTFGIGENEIKSILSGMHIEGTDDVSLAIPIANEDRSDVKLDGIINIEKPPIYYDELYEIGECAKYVFGPQDEYHEYPWNKYTITVESFEIRDSVKGLSEKAIERKDVLDKFTDSNGKLVSYRRTELLHDENNDPFFGETVDMTKRLVLVTVKLDDFYCNAGGTPQVYLRSYSLYDLVKNEDETVKRYGREEQYVVDSTPGQHAEINEVVYNEDLGGGYYRLGYLLDVDQLDGELLLMGYTPNIHYVLK